MNIYIQTETEEFTLTGLPKYFRQWDPRSKQYNAYRGGFTLMRFDEVDLWKEGSSGHEIYHAQETVARCSIKEGFARIRGKLACIQKWISKNIATNEHIVEWNRTPGSSDIYVRTMTVVDGFHINWDFLYKETKVKTEEVEIHLDVPNSVA